MSKETNGLQSMVEKVRDRQSGTCGAKINAPQFSAAAVPAAALGAWEQAPRIGH